ncbi:MAG: response regulator transcription factor [Anaerolineae bacterium]|nr:response regulator transcription factor [Anaerolineae bacterium]
MPNPKSILVVDDEATIRDVVSRYLQREGFRVREAADGYACLDAIADQVPDLIVLDLMLPGIDGLTITRQLRMNPKHKAIPIVMLTAKGETNDRIRGLDIGADDYIPKPFAPREVVSRVNAVLRRTGEPIIEVGERLEIGDVAIDAGARTVTINGKNIALSAKEFDLLYYFAQQPRQVFNREQLLENVWGYEFFGDASTVTVHIRRLREKIETDPSDPKRIVTVWGVGYKFEG